MTDLSRPSMRLRAEGLRPLVVTREDAAALLSCSKDCVDDLIARGKLEAVKLGNRRVGVKMRSIERVAEMGVGCLSHGHTKRERPARRSEALL